MTESMGPGGLEGPQWERIREHLKALEFDQAAEALSRLLPQVQDPRERVVIYQLLASACWTWAAEQRIRGQQDSAASYRESVRQTYQRALLEFPFHPGLRVGMGLFLLLDEESPEACLPYLEPIQGQTVQAEDEQRRLAVRGVALILMGEEQEGEATLLDAYGDPFPKHLTRPDISPLGILVRRGARLPGGALESLLERLRKYQETNAEQLEQLRKSLAG